MQTYLKCKSLSCVLFFFLLLSLLFFWVEGEMVFGFESRRTFFLTDFFFFSIASCC